MSLRSILAPARASTRALFVARPVARYADLRAFHASSSSLKKKAFDQEEDEFEEEEEIEDDLFGSTTSVEKPRPAGADPNKAVERETVKDHISRVCRIPAAQRKNDAVSTRTSFLNRYYQSMESGEDVEGLKGVLKGWRVMRKGIKREQAEEMISRVLRLGRQDIAFEIAADPVQYGFPVLSPDVFNRMQTGYLETRYPAPPVPELRPGTRFTLSNAILRLATYQHWQYNPSNLDKAEGTEETEGAEEVSPAEIKEVESRTVKPLEIVEKILRDGLVENKPLEELKGYDRAQRKKDDKRVNHFTVRLERQGGEWKEALDKLRESAGKATTA